MNDQKQIEEMEEEKTSKQWQRRDEYCLRIQKATQYKGNCDHEDIPSILVDYEKEIKEDLVPKNAVVLTREEADAYIYIKDHYGDFNDQITWEDFSELMADFRKDARRETAEKIYSMAKEVVEKTKHIVDGKPYLHIDVLKLIIKQLGVDLEEEK